MTSYGEPANLNDIRELVWNNAQGRIEQPKLGHGDALTLGFHSPHRGVEFEAQPFAPVGTSLAGRFNVAVSPAEKSSMGVVTQAYLDRLERVSAESFVHAVHVLRPADEVVPKRTMIDTEGHVQRPEVAYENINCTSVIVFHFYMPVKLIDSHGENGASSPVQNSLDNADNNGMTIDMWMPAASHFMHLMDDEDSPWIVKPILPVESSSDTVDLPMQRTMHLLTVRELQFTDMPDFVDDGVSEHALVRSEIGDQYKNWQFKMNVLWKCLGSCNKEPSETSDP